MPSYSQIVKIGIKKKLDRKTLNAPKLLNRLENYYGGSDTFLGKNNSILSKIMGYKFTSCLGCKKFLNDNKIVCENCIETKMIKVDNKILVLCQSCNDYHNEVRFKIECEVCKENSNTIFNVNGIDVCRRCINNSDSDPDSDSDSYSEVE